MPWACTQGFLAQPSLPLPGPPPCPLARGLSPALLDCCVIVGIEGCVLSGGKGWTTFSFLPQATFLLCFFSQAVRVLWVRFKPPTARWGVNRFSLVLGIGLEGLGEHGCVSTCGEVFLCCPGQP